MKDVLLSIGPNKFLSGTAEVGQWCEVMSTVGPHVLIVIHEANKGSNMLSRCGSSYVGKSFNLVWEWFDTIRYQQEP